MLGLFMYVLVVEVPEFHLLCFLQLTLFGLRRRYFFGRILEGFAKGWRKL
jgi:hypothetical protein